MTTRLRQVGLIVRTAVRSSPTATVAVLVLVPLGAVTQPLLAFWLALMLRGALRHDTELLVLGAVAIVVSQGVYYVSDICTTNMRFSLVEKVGHAFDTQIALVCASLPRLDDVERPEVQERLELLRQTQGLLGSSLEELVMAVAEVTVALVSLSLLITASPILLLLVPFGLPALYTGAIAQRALRRAEEGTATQGRLARHWQSLAEAPRSAAMVRVTGMATILPSLLRAALDRAERPIVRARQRGVLLSFVEQVVFALGYLGAIAFMVWRARQGQADASEVVLVAVVGLGLQAQIVGPIKTVGQHGQAFRAAGRVLWLRSYADERLPPATAVQDDMRAERELVRLRQVTFTYPQVQRPSLVGVTTDLRPGSVVAIVGENGAGKSTLVNLLCGLYTPSSGQILVGSTSIHDMQPEMWRSHLSAAFQDHVDFELAARAAIGVGDLPRMADGPAVESALQRAGASDLRAALPAGLDTQLGARWPNGIDISGGQWQAVALARACMRDAPRLIVLDEPTANLDAQAEHDLFAHYSGATEDWRSRGCIVVLVSHRFSTVRMADHILVLEHGRLIEEGSHHELMTHPGLYRELYTIQAQGYRQ